MEGGLTNNESFINVRRILRVVRRYDNTGVLEHYCYKIGLTGSVSLLTLDVLLAKGGILAQNLI